MSGEILKFKSDFGHLLFTQQDIINLIDGQQKEGDEYPFPDSISPVTASLFKSLYITSVDGNNNRVSKFDDVKKSTMDSSKDWLFENNHEMQFLIRPIEPFRIKTELYGYRKNVPIEIGFGTTDINGNEQQALFDFPIDNRVMDIHTHPLEQVAFIEFDLEGDWYIKNWLLGEGFDNKLIDPVIKDSLLGKDIVKDRNGKLVNGSYALENARKILLKNDEYLLIVTKESYYLKYRSGFTLSGVNEYKNVLKKIESIDILDVNLNNFNIEYHDLKEIFNGNGIYNVTSQKSVNSNGDSLTTITSDCYFHSYISYAPSGYDDDLYPRKHWQWLLLKDYLIAYRSTAKGEGDVQAVYDLNNGTNIGVDINNHQDWMDSTTISMEEYKEVNSYRSWKYNNPTYAIEYYYPYDEAGLYETGKAWNTFNMYGVKINTEREQMKIIRADDSTRIYNLEARQDGTIKMEIYDELLLDE